MRVNEINDRHSLNGFGIHKRELPLSEFHSFECQIMRHGAEAQKNKHSQRRRSMAIHPFPFFCKSHIKAPFARLDLDWPKLQAQQVKHRLILKVLAFGSSVMSA